MKILKAMTAIALSISVFYLVKYIGNDREAASKIRQNGCAYFKKLEIVNSEEFAKEYHGILEILKSGREAVDDARCKTCSTPKEEPEEEPHHAHVQGDSKPIDSAFYQITGRSMGFRFEKSESGSSFPSEFGDKGIFLLIVGPPIQKIRGRVASSLGKTRWTVITKDGEEKTIPLDDVAVTRSGNKEESDSFVPALRECAERFSWTLPRLSRRWKYKDAVSGFVVEKADPATLIWKAESIPDEIGYYDDVVCRFGDDGHLASWQYVKSIADAHGFAAIRLIIWLNRPGQ